MNVRKQKKAPVKVISADLTPSSVVSSCPPDLYDSLVIHGIINSAFLPVCTILVSLILLTLLILQRNALKPLVKHGILEWMTPSVFFFPISLCQEGVRSPWTQPNDGAPPSKFSIWSSLNSLSWLQAMPKTLVSKVPQVAFFFLKFF